MKIEYLSSAADRSGRFRIQLDDGRVLRLYRQTVQDFCLYAGMELTQQQLDDLLAAAGKMSAKMRAVRIVSTSSISKKDLQQRLIHKGEAPADAEAAVKWMSELSLVDDRKTAEQIIARCIAKGYGLARAKQALYEKRIPKEFWAEALEDYPCQTDYIKEFLSSRLDGDSDRKEIRRAVDALIRRGHSYSEIRSELERLSVSTDDE